jgi:hypothetical protein
MSCLITTDTGASVTIAQPDISERLPEREMNQPYVLQVASDRIPVMKEALVELTLRQHPLRTWVFVTMIINEFILGLDVLHAHDASVDLGCCVLQLAKEEVPLWHSGA